MFCLTRQERQVILFLVVVFLIGIGFNFLSKKYPKIKSISYELEAIELNRADLESLVSVPGIKEKLAREIIRYRSENQGFRDLQELKEIRGIGEKKYELIKDYFFLE